MTLLRGAASYLPPLPSRKTGRRVCVSKWRTFLWLTWLVSVAWFGGVFPVHAEVNKPNVIFIMADDLGYGDLGCYGQQQIVTPHLDQMAREGLRFRQFYAGCTVCAPSRCVLMTGKHMGHAQVRGNSRGTAQTLLDADVTVAEVFQAAGYATALVGKWGLGDDLPGNTGLPNDQGFELFFGYLNQAHAHNYYPEFLWLNRKKFPLRNTVQAVGNNSSAGFVGGYATERVDYSHDLVMQRALDFITSQRERPFFLYLSLTIPHANNEGTRGTGNGQEVPHFGIYADRDWSAQDKGQAAMISRMDHGIGALLRKLRELKIDENTVVMFTSDNGPHNEGGHDPQRFQPSGPLRGMKRSLYEGGIRVPMIVRWPGKTPAGTISDHVGYFGDLMATVLELTGQPRPAGLDSISFVPTINGGTARQAEHDYLYWEFYEQGSRQAVRRKSWKAIRAPIATGVTELYDLSSDLGESHNIAASHPDVVALLEQTMDEAHIVHPNWKPSGTVPVAIPPPGDGRLRF